MKDKIAKDLEQLLSKYDCKLNEENINALLLDSDTWGLWGKEEKSDVINQYGMWYLREHVYNHIFGEYKENYSTDKETQRRYDTMLYDYEKNITVGVAKADTTKIEEKAEVNWTGNVAIELIDGHRRYEVKDGWIFDTDCDWIYYVFPIANKCVIIDNIQELKKLANKWREEGEPDSINGYRVTKNLKDGSPTRLMLVPASNYEIFDINKKAIIERGETHER